MFMVFPLLIALTVAVLVHNLWTGGIKLPGLTRGGWGAPANTDPRVAVAAMMHLVAAESGGMTHEKTEQMASLLETMVDLTPAEAKVCLANGRAVARRTEGSLNSRLHQLRGPIERNCNGQEKEEVIAMLRAVAGASAERVPAVREALGRIAGSLLHG